MLKASSFKEVCKLLPPVGFVGEEGGEEVGTVLVGSGGPPPVAGEVELPAEVGAGEPMATGERTDST